ncbi:class I SAM-dependent methyltransferase [Aeromicrobium sp.]|uniref:class I SAM-dependent methyltransferase n=1 Tax=Aeromicrobium sp. TaxID=1871063 RepID=UPI002FCA9710
MPILARRQCSLDRRPWPQRVSSAATRPLTRYLSSQAAYPHGFGGSLIGRLWVKETANVNDVALDVLAPAGGEDILEIGFGPGRTLGKLAERGARVAGVDVSGEMVRLATRRNQELVRSAGLGLTQTDGIGLPFEDGSFDVVLSVHNLYFWPEPATTLAEIVRVLRPGGRALLVFRGREHPLPKRLDPAVYREVTTAQCVDWMTRAGFVTTSRVRPPAVSTEVSFVLGSTSA